MLSNVILAESISHRARFAWLAAALAATVALATLSFGATESSAERRPRVELRSPMCGEWRASRHHDQARDAERAADRDRERLERKIERAKERAQRFAERAERRAAREAERAAREAEQAQREAEQAVRDAVQIQRDAEQALREAGREAREAVRATSVYIFR